MPQNDVSRAMGTAVRDVARAIGALVETAFPRDVPRAAPDAGIIDVAYPETAKLVVVTTELGKVIAVRYGAIQLPFTTECRIGSVTVGAFSPIVSMRLRRRPS